MTSDKDASEYFEKVVASLDARNVDDLAYARRQFYKVKPGDPTFAINIKERQQIGEKLAKLAASFWDNQYVKEELNNLEMAPYPELEEWHESLKALAEEKEAIKEVFFKDTKQTQKVSGFYQKYLPSSEADAIKFTRKFRLKHFNDKNFIKWNNKALDELKLKAPRTFEKLPKNLYLKHQRKPFFSSNNDSSVFNGWVIFVIIWLILKFITMISQ